MGVAISGWRLARSVSVLGQLGVVSGTALDVLLARRLQDGDPDGDIRRAVAAFPVPAVAQWVLDAYYVPGGLDADAMYRPVPRHTVASSSRLVELTVLANFVEVWLAKEGHPGRVGINYLKKIDLPLPASMYGALLAGVDDVLVGAGSPAEIPALLRALARHEDVTLSTKVQLARSDEDLGTVAFSPRGVFGSSTVASFGSLRVPRMTAIVASVDLAAGLAADPVTRPDGFVVEGPSAGGHNAPPRGPRRIDAEGQPVYDDRDVVDIEQIVALGLPVWLAGSYGSPSRLLEALALGAAGIQVGTAFAYCDESGMSPALRQAALTALDEGSLKVRADWRASPTGFPFHVAELPQTWTDPAAVAERAPVCDLGVLRSPYRTDAGEVDYRCPAEPLPAYLRKGGREANVEGRVCLCNALFATAGHPSRRRGGVVEPPLLTSGSDLAPVVELLRRHREASGAAAGEASYAPRYSAADVITYLLCG